MNQDQKRQLENFIISQGFTGLDDLDQLPVYARIVEDFPGDKHWFYRGMLNECEADKRRDMYYSLKPHFTRFKPKPLETYLAEIAEDAGRMVSQRIMRVEGPRPGAIHIGDDGYFVAEANGDHTAIKLTCSKCTGQRVFVGDTLAGAYIRARKKGWVKDGDKEICPKCPAVRERKVLPRRCCSSTSVD